MKQSKNLKVLNNKLKRKIFLYRVYRKVFSFLDFYNFPEKVMNKIIILIRNFLVYVISEDFSKIRLVNRLKVIRFILKNKNKNKKERNIDFIILLKFTSIFNKFIYI